MRVNGAITGGAAGFKTGDEVIVMKKFGDEPKFYVVAHTDGIRACDWESWSGPLVTTNHPWGLRGFWDISGSVQLVRDLPYFEDGRIIIPVTVLGDHDLTYDPIHDYFPEVLPLIDKRPKGLFFRYKGLVTVRHESSLSGQEFWADDSVSFFIADEEGNYVWIVPYAHSHKNSYYPMVIFDDITGPEGAEDMTREHDLSAYGLTGDISWISMEGLGGMTLGGVHAGGNLQFRIDSINFSREATITT